MLAMYRGISLIKKIAGKTEGKRKITGKDVLFKMLLLCQKKTRFFQCSNST